MKRTFVRSSNSYFSFLTAVLKFPRRDSLLDNGLTAIASFFSALVVYAIGFDTSPNGVLSSYLAVDTVASIILEVVVSYFRGDLLSLQKNY